MTYLPYNLVERAAAQGYQHAAYRLKDMVQSMSFGLTNYGKIFTEGMKTTAKIKDLQKVGQEVSTLKQIAKAAKTVTDNLKAGAFKQVNTGLANSVSVGVTLLSAGLTVLAIKNQEEIQEIDLRKEIVTSSEFTRNMKILIKQNAIINTIEQQVKAYKVTVDKTYAEAAGAAKNAIIAREKANDALYEARQGRKIVEDKIDTANKKANDALYETRQGRTKLEAEIATAKKQSNDALYETRQGRTKLEAEIATAKKQTNDALYETRQGRTKLETEISSLQIQVKQSSNEFQKTLQTTINNVLKDVNSYKLRLNKQDQKSCFFEKTLGTVQGIGKILQDELTANKRAITEAKKDQELQTIKTVSNVTKEYLTSYEDTVQGLKERQAASVQLLADLRQQQNSTFERINQQFKEVLDRIPNAFKEATGKIDNEFTKIKEEFAKVANKIEVAKQEKIDTTIDSKITYLQSQVTQQKAELSQTQTNLKELDTRIKDQDKMNTAGIAKLDQILGTLPLIPARVNALISPKIPSAAQIEQAATTGVCNSTKPGGCMANSLNSGLNGLRSNLQNDINTILGAANSAASAVQLTLLQTIDTKLGAQITGGIGGKLVDGFKWLHLDRALSILTFAATVQNHLMLSRDIGTTLLGAFSNVLSLIGLKDDQGNAFNLGSIISSSTETLVKGIVGAENYTTMSETWAKANRIYQATTNVLNSFQNISNTILSGMEIIGGNNSKIGNALKKAGTVLDNAYGWMNPQPKFNRITQTLEKLQAGASTIQQITQVPLDIIQATTELQNANTELIKAIKEDDSPKNKAIETPEPDKLKADELAAKISSRISNILPDDLFNAAD